MPVGWNNVQDAIKAAVVATGGLGAASISWVDDKRPTGKVIGILDLVYLQNMQDRDTYTEKDGSPGEFEWALSSLYYVRVQIRVESIFNTPQYDALFALEKIRAGLRNPMLVVSDDIRLQPDESTYVHHVSFTKDDHVVSAYSLEFGVRCVLDYPLTGPVDGEPNMQEVTLEGDVDVGELADAGIDRVVTRP
jgi:hypothetical protein